MTKFDFNAKYAVGELAGFDLYAYVLATQTTSGYTAIISAPDGNFIYWHFLHAFEDWKIAYTYESVYKANMLKNAAKPVTSIHNIPKDTYNYTVKEIAKLLGKLNGNVTIIADAYTVTVR